MRKTIFTAALAEILPITVAACGGNGGDGGDGGEERLLPILRDATFLQIQEGREYFTMTSSDGNRHLSDRINAIHQGGYELQHTTSDRLGYVLFGFRMIAVPEDHRPRPARHPQNRTAVSDYPPAWQTLPPPFIPDISKGRSSPSTSKDVPERGKDPAKPRATP